MAEGQAHAQEGAREETSVEDLVDAIVTQDVELAPADAARERAAMARALFSDGLAAAQEARFAEAADLFERAHALRPAPGTAYNLASALAQIGQLLAASELLQWVSRHPDSTTEMRVAAESAIAQITPRLAHVRVVLCGSTDGVDVLLDGAPLAYAAIGVDVPLDPGAHRFVAMRGEARVAVRRIELAEGARRDIALTIARGPEAAPAPAPIAERPDEPPPADDLAWLGWSGAALGVAIVAAVITAAVVAGEQGAWVEPVPGTTMPRVLEWE